MTHSNFLRAERFFTFPHTLVMHKTSLQIGHWWITSFKLIAIKWFKIFLQWKGVPFSWFDGIWTPTFHVHSTTFTINNMDRFTSLRFTVCTLMKDSLLPIHFANMQKFYMCKLYAHFSTVIMPSVLSFSASLLWTMFAFKCINEPHMHVIYKAMPVLVLVLVEHSGEKGMHQSYQKWIHILME